MFVERMKREGRLKEFTARVRKHQAETGKTFTPAAWPVMREMGYESVTKERWLLEEHERTLHLTSAQKDSRRMCAMAREDKRVDAFEKALATLPASASKAVEWEWIGSHPAFVKAQRKTGKSKDIVLTADDILTVHGVAPSKWAVGALQYFANNPQKYYESSLSHVKKQEDSPGSESVSGGDDLSEVERLLKEVLDANSDVRSVREEGGDNRGAVISAP